MLGGDVPPQPQAPEMPHGHPSHANSYVQQGCQVVPVCCRAPRLPKVFPHGVRDALQNPGIQSLAPHSGHRPEALAQTQMT